MKRVHINAPVEYVAGHLRLGHYEGVVNLTDEEFEEFQKNPIETIKELNLLELLNFEVDDWEVYDIGDIEDAGWMEV